MNIIMPCRYVDVKPQKIRYWTAPLCLKENLLITEWLTLRLDSSDFTYTLKKIRS